MQVNYFSRLLPELAIRASRATVSRLGFSNPPLRRQLMNIFGQGYGTTGSFLADPVFEATFGWETAKQTMSQLAPALLHPALVTAMDSPPGGAASDYRFPKGARPYTHQLDAWTTLLDATPRSVVVTSGTGSGKTECFMVPILSRLATERQERGPLVGVRALFLYPLNALIQSQRERLTAWTAAFGSDVRFCLYNGNTPEKSKAERQRETQNEVLDREILRASPPPILVTNPTMLEYMLVRAQDAPILDKSQGKLEWVVLDEAHNYVGSQAAELALLLRRVLHAFGVRADRVRFVATSATIGVGEHVTRQLQEYLAKLAGVSPDRVHVIEGRRSIPEIKELIHTGATVGLETLESESDRQALFTQLASHPVARKLRDLFVSASGGRPFQQLSAIAQQLAMHGGGVPPDDSLALRWVDVMTEAVRGDAREATPFLPLRLHAFHNTLNGLWACADPQCQHKTGTDLEHDDWKFGAVYTEERRHCQCGAPVYPLTSCNDCNVTFLRADQVVSEGIGRLLPPRPVELDEFNLDQEPAEDEGEGATPDVESGMRSASLIANGSLARTVAINIDRSSCEVDPSRAERPLSLRVRDIEEKGGRWVLSCPECQGYSQKPEQQFRKPILGAPFLLGEIIPTLLEFCPDGEAPMARPMRGRRMISFTDSRQGTARLAAKLQQDAERNTVRAAVYKRVVGAVTSGASDESQKFEQDLQKFRDLEKMIGGEGQEFVRRQIDDLEKKIGLLSAPKALPFMEVADWLATGSQDVGTWIHSYYAALASEFRAADGKEQIAKILLMREFARRPKRVNSLETLGLVAVRYPKLERVTSRLPAVEQAGLSLEEWRDFLKLALDFYVRENTFVLLPDSWRKWGGNRIGAKQLLSPTSAEQPTNRLKKWPQCLLGARQPRLVRLLAYVLKRDPATPDGRDMIDSLLRAAWDDLAQRAHLLQQGQDGRYLALDDLAFSAMNQGWVCPVTRRILDTTLRGVTPYLPSHDVNDGVANCRQVSIPICALLANDYDSEDARLVALRGWVNSQPSIAEARLEGLWSDLSDRIVEGSRYFRAVEHSAQQSGAKLADYESQFKAGRINLMSCSTTMEMGVDIGGINMVAMNNVPPHPANYLQRAGRAGRRGETRSVALTLCKNNPHDQQVFANTLWPFISRLPTPSISLSSPLIVQRHVNSLLLSYFLRRADEAGSLNKLTMEWWMLPRGSSRQEQFLAWCQCFDASSEERISEGLEALIKHTVFEGDSGLSSLAAAAGNAALVQAKDWLGELDAIDGQAALFESKDKEKDPAFKSLRIQRARLTGEYLLRELATGGFLPGYGFPTDITSFETLNRDGLQATRLGHGVASREDNRYERRELPSRDTVTALREYAPGANVVIDGLVYGSAGITLNWHAPATTQEVAEIQNIRHAWRCGHCGASGTTPQALLLENCPECGSELQRATNRQLTYLEPAGFSVDIYESTHNDVSIQTYVPVENPWINGDGDWMPLSNSALGRFRTTPLGSVFHYSSGAQGMGYAVCLDCGRAAPMGDLGDGNATPYAFRRPHKRLRGAQGGQDRECAGSNNEFAIKKGLRFGREYTTDVLELVLVGVNGRPLSDLTTAYSIGVAVRQAIAASLGVDETELGCDTKPIRTAAGEIGRSIQVFDMRSAGYSSLVGPNLNTLLRDARAHLLCPQDCDSACQHCLMTFDTRYRIDALDRHKALEFLSQKWLEALKLPEVYAYLGTTSVAEYQPLAEALTREFNRPDSHSLVVYLSGPPAEWDVAASPVRSLLHRLSSNGSKRISIVMEPGAKATVAPENLAVLRGLHDACGVALWEGLPPLSAAGSAVLATVSFRDGLQNSFAVADGLTAQIGPSWGSLCGTPLIMGQTGKPELIGEMTLSDGEVALPVLKGASQIEISKELDGAANGFGARLVALILQQFSTASLPGANVATSLRYEDRYLRNPLSAGLLIEFVSSLKQHLSAEDRWNVKRAFIVTCPADGEGHRVFGPPVYVSHDWASSSARDEALLEAFAFCGLDADIEVLDRRDTLHSRVLTVGFDDGRKLTIWFDQGFSYWAAARGVPAFPTAFPFSATTADQGEAIALPRFKVIGHQRPTQLFVTLS